MTKLEDIIGSIITGAVGADQYEIVKGKVGEFALKQVSNGYIHENGVYTLSFWKKSIEKGSWKIISQPKKEKMNTKIEVGDKVSETWSTSPDLNAVYTVTKIDGNWIYYNREENGSYVRRDQLKLVEKAKKPKQVSNSNTKKYITLQELPDIAKGTIGESASGTLYRFATKNGAWKTRRYKEETLLASPEFFKEYIEPFTVKAGDYLYCHTSLIMIGSGIEQATQGKIYKSENNKCFTNNKGNTAHELGEKAPRWFRKATEKEVEAYKKEHSEVKLSVGSPLTEVTIKKEGVVKGRVNGNSFSMPLESLKAFISIINNNLKTLGGYSTSIKEATIHIGCSKGIDVSLSDINKVIEAHSKL